MSTELNTLDSTRLDELERWLDHFGDQPGANLIDDEWLPALRRLRIERNVATQLAEEYRQKLCTRSVKE